MTGRRIDFRPSVVEARIFDKGGYKERSAYLGSFVIHIFGEAAEVTLLTGVCEDDACSWDMELDREVMSYLQGHGVTRLRYEHKGEKVECDTATGRRQNI